MTVKLDIDKAMKTITKDVDKVMQGTLLELFGNIVRATPVGNPSIWNNPDAKPKGYSGGRLRANWQVSLGRPATGTVGTVDKSGSATVARETADIEKYSVDSTLYFTNNMPYAEAVEYGHSKQAPSGMVRVNIETLQRQLDKAARKHG